LTPYSELRKALSWGFGARQHVAQEMGIVKKD
jgi:hypothetical protein